MVAIYLLVIHAFLLVVLWKSDFVPRVEDKLGLASPAPQTVATPYFRRLVKYHRRSVEIVPDGATLFFGDSLVQGLCVAAVAPNSVNYGIGSDTTRGILQRLPEYQSALRRASAVVLAVGTNDLSRDSVTEVLARYQRIVDTLPDDRTVIVSSVLPVDESARDDLPGRNQNILALNEQLANLAQSKAHILYVDNTERLDRNNDGQLDASLHVGDGVHLNSQGNAIWAEGLQAALRQQTQ